jgi:hypothetical protein
MVEVSAESAKEHTVRRPAGVSFLAMLMLCYGGLLLVQVAQVARPDFGISYINSHLQALLPSGRTDAAGVLYFSGVGALVSLLTAGGLWFLKEPGRWGMLLIPGIPVTRGLIQAASIIATDADKVWKQMGDAFWIELLGYVVLIMYLFRPDVQGAFGRRDRYSGEFDPGKKLPEEYDYDREQ